MARLRKTRVPSTDRLSASSGNGLPGDNFGSRLAAPKSGPAATDPSPRSHKLVGEVIRLSRRSEERSGNLWPHRLAWLSPGQTLGSLRTPRSAKRSSGSPLSSLSPQRTLCSSTRYTRRRTTLPWGSFPYDVSNADSDKHRAYHTRLCCAFRFSQPLGALFRPRSFGLVSCRIRPWGYGFQRFPSPRSRHGFHRALSLVPVAARKRGWGCGIHAPGRSVHDEPVLPGDVGRSSLSLLPLRGILPSSLGFAFQQSLLSWAFPQR